MNDLVYWQRRLRFDYVTTLLASFFIGVYVLLVIIIIRGLLERPANGLPRKIMMCYTLSMLVLAIGWYIGGAAANIDLLSGFNNLEEVETVLSTTVPAQRVRDICKVLQMCGADGLLIWRAHVICNTRKVLTPILSVLWIGVLGVGLMSTYETAYVVQFILISLAISVGLNILATAFIGGTLLRQRRYMQSMRQPMSTAPPLSLYGSITAVFVESAVLYTGSGLLYFPFQLLNSPYVDPFSLLFRISVMFGPALIQLRVAKGVAHTGNPALSSTQLPLTLRAHHRCSIAPSSIQASDYTFDVNFSKQRESSLGQSRGCRSVIDLSSVAGK